MEDDRGIEKDHDNHKLDIHATYNDIALWFGYLDWSLVGKNLDFSFLDYNSGNIQQVLEELVLEGFLTTMDNRCGGCGGLVYVRTDTMKWPSSVLYSEDEKMCRFA